MNASPEWYLIGGSLATWQRNDFEFVGREQDPRWQEDEGQARKADQWTEWEIDESIQLEVRTRQLKDCFFLLDQKHYVRDFEEIDLVPQRKKQRQEAVADPEKTQMTTVLGAVQNKVKKTGPAEAAECGVLRSKRPPMTVPNIVAVNKMTGCLKALMEQRWEDAAEGNR